MTKSVTVASNPAPGESVRNIALGTSGAGCSSVFATPFVDHAVVVCGPGDSASAVVVDLESGSILHELTLTGRPKGHDGFVLDAAVSPDASRIVIGGGAQGPSGEPASFAGTTDLATGDALLSTLELDSWIIGAVEWTPNGSQILAGGQFGDFLFVDPDTLTIDHLVPTSPLAAITDISFNSEGTVAVVANEHGEVWLVDLALQEALGDPYMGSASQFQGAAISPDGSRLAAVGRDGDLRIWDAETGTLVTSPLSGPGVDGGKVRFVANDRLITFGDGPARLWDFDVERLQDLACQLAGRVLTDDELVAYTNGLTQSDVCAP